MTNIIEPLKICIVDDNDPFRRSLRFYLENTLKYKVIFEANNGQSFLENIPAEADIVLMDINMPLIDGIKATKLATYTRNDLKIIAVSQNEVSYGLSKIISAGFKGFVSKPKIVEQLNTAIADVLKGKLYFPNF